LCYDLLKNVQLYMCVCTCVCGVCVRVRVRVRVCVRMAGMVMAACSGFAGAGRPVCYNLSKNLHYLLCVRVRVAGTVMAPCPRSCSCRGIREASACVTIHREICNYLLCVRVAGTVMAACPSSCTEKGSEGPASFSILILRC